MSEVKSINQTTPPPQQSKSSVVPGAISAAVGAGAGVGAHYLLGGGMGASMAKDMVGKLTKDEFISKELAKGLEEAKKRNFSQESLDMMAKNLRSSLDSNYDKLKEVIKKSNNKRLLYIAAGAAAGLAIFTTVKKLVSGKKEES